MSRDTGPTPATRTAVRERDGERCIACTSTHDLQIHHRRPRGMGGTSRVDTNGQANLVLLCAACHSRVESEREWAFGAGLLVSQYATPAEQLLRWNGVWVLLTDDGLVHRNRPVRVVEEPTLISGSSTTDPSYAELRARNLLAQSLLDQRQTTTGLAPADVTQILNALRGQFDGMAACG